MQNIINRIEQEITPGTEILKPAARGNFVVKRWGRRRGERALIHMIPNHRDPARPYQKGITESEWNKAFDQLKETGEFNRAWFVNALSDCNRECGCDFTTIGGIFELLGIAKYKRGAYKKA